MLEIILEALAKNTEIAEAMRENLFSANHRNHMLEQYGYSQAMNVSVEELLLTL